MTPRVWAVLLFVTAAFAADWDRDAATRYLDARQQAWAEWPTAKAAGGSCMSCHTGMTFLLARPFLRDPASQPTPCETAEYRARPEGLARSALKSTVARWRMDT